MSMEPNIKAILPNFYHEDIDSNFQSILDELPPLIEPRGFLTSFALINSDLVSVTIKWHGIVPGVSLNQTGKKYFIDKTPLQKKDEKCGLIWMVLDSKIEGTQKNGLEEHSDRGFYRAKNPLNGPLKECFVPVTDQTTKDSFLMPLFDFEKTNLIGVFAVDSEREDIFNPESERVANLVSFVHFLEIVVNSINIAYYDFLCMDMGVFNRNYLLYILRKGEI